MQSLGPSQATILLLGPFLKWHLHLNLNLNPVSNMYVDKINSIAVRLLEHFDVDVSSFLTHIKQLKKRHLRRETTVRRVDVVAYIGKSRYTTSLAKSSLISLITCYLYQLPHCTLLSKILNTLVLFIQSFSNDALGIQVTPAPCLEYIILRTSSDKHL